MREKNVVKTRDALGYLISGKINDTTAWAINGSFTFEATYRRHCSTDGEPPRIILSLSPSVSPLLPLPFLLYFAFCYYFRIFNHIVYNMIKLTFFPLFKMYIRNLRHLYFITRYHYITYYD